MSPALDAPRVDDLRDGLRRLADVLLPAADGFPSATEAGIADAILDRVLRSRPDLIDALQECSHLVEGRDPMETLTAIKARPRLYDALCTVVIGGYFISPVVRGLYGYRGQQAVDIDVYELPEYLVDGSLDRVRSRGPIYRATPEGAVRSISDSVAEAAR